MLFDLWMTHWDKQDRESSEDAIAPQKSLGPVNPFLTGLKGYKDCSLLYRSENILHRLHRLHPELYLLW